MEARRFGFRDIVGEARRLCSEHVVFLAGLTALVAAGYAVLDLAVAPDTSSLPNLAVGIFVQYLVLERLLADRLLVGESGRSYGAMFVASLLSGLGMIIGFILFVVPGLILAAGWSAASAFIVVDQDGGVAALRKSWRATIGSRWPIILVIVASYVPLMLVFAASIAGLTTFSVVSAIFDGVSAETIGRALDDAVEPPWAIVVIQDFLISVVGTWGWLLGAAVYRLAVPSDSLIEDVFG